MSTKPGIKEAFFVPSSRVHKNPACKVQTSNSKAQSPERFPWILPPFALPRSDIGG
jgi:hypothetical protein